MYRYVVMGEFTLFLTFMVKLLLYMKVNSPRPKSRHSLNKAITPESLQYRKQLLGM